MDIPGHAQPLLDRVAGAPITWGVCEVPGWGAQLPADRVLGEMRRLGLRATELGPLGYLGQDPAAVRALLDRHGLRLAAGFVPLVLHSRSARHETRAALGASVAFLAGAGASALLSAAVVDDGWSPRVELGDAEWAHMTEMLREMDERAGEAGLVHALHPHVGTLVETRDDVERLLVSSDVHWCLDTGHLAIGGTDPLTFARSAADRVAHVHLKDVRAPVADRLRAGLLSLVEATGQGIFCPLGAGDVPVVDVVRTLEDSGYAGWYVLEQDTALSGEVAPGAGPIDDARRSVAFLRSIQGLDCAIPKRGAM
jgi:inosose dehydratase